MASIAELLTPDHTLINMTTESRIEKVKREMQDAHNMFVKCKHLKNAGTKYFQIYQEKKQELEELMEEK